jgi:colanic acid/amylovoran biosynthesis glycosyltransferase
MNRLTVAHFINPFLPLTQNWMYHQLRYNAECRAIVLCQTVENLDQFPLENVFPAFPKSSALAEASMLISRLRARYLSRPYLEIIRQEKPDALHGHFSWESWRNITVVRKTRLPLVTTFYGLDVNKLSRRRMWKKRYAALFDIGALFTVEGNHMAGALQAIGCPRDKIRVVPLGVDIDIIEKHRSSTNGRTTTNVMFVGLEREKKGALYAAGAFARVASKNTGLELHVLGNGPYARPVKELLSRAGVIDRCVFHGYIPYTDYLALLGTMDVVLTPSVTAKNGDTEGGAPVVAIEAQAAGLPVVGTTHCDIPDIVLHNETGLLCAERDVEALAANLHLLVTDCALRKKLGDAARIRARNNFSIHRQISDLNSLYRSLV